MPPLKHLVLRSVHLSPHGAGITLRVEFPHFPDRAPAAWGHAGCDRFEAQISFLAVGEDVQMRGIPHGTPIDVELTALERPWMRVLVHGAELTLRFSATTVMQVSHLNAYSSRNADPYTVPRCFESPVDQRLYDVLPATTRRPFYDH